MIRIAAMVALAAAACSPARSEDICSRSAKIAAEILVEGLGLEDHFPQRRKSELITIFNFQDVSDEGIGPDPVPVYDGKGRVSGKEDSGTGEKIFCSASVRINYATVRSLNDSVLSSILAKAAPGAHLSVPPPQAGDRARYEHLQSRMAVEGLSDISRGVRARYTVDTAANQKVTIINFPDWN